MIVGCNCGLPGPANRQTTVDKTAKFDKTVKFRTQRQHIFLKEKRQRKVYSFIMHTTDLQNNFSAVHIF